jgi:hypothetical protein
MADREVDIIQRFGLASPTDSYDGIVLTDHGVIRTRRSMKFAKKDIDALSIDEAKALVDALVRKVKAAPVTAVRKVFVHKGQRSLQVFLTRHPAFKKAEFVTIEHTADGVVITKAATPKAKAKKKPKKRAKPNGEAKPAVHIEVA